MQKVWGFLEGEWKTNKERVDYKKLIKEGVCFACGDEVIDYRDVERFILSPEKVRSGDHAGRL